LSQPWTDVDLTSAAGAPAGDGPFGFFTNLPGEGPTARVVYTTHERAIEELYVGADGSWRARQLTDNATVFSTPVASVTSFADGSPVAQIYFLGSGNHIMELSNPGTGWSLADLTAISGGPPLSTRSSFDNIRTFTTALPGQATTQHVLYTADYDLEDLSTSDGRTWHASLLTAISDVSSTAEGYVTELAGQGPVARIVYGTASQTIREMSTDGHSAWSNADLSTIAGVTLNTVASPQPYTTNLAGQGPVARVLYFDWVDPVSSADNRRYIGELSVAGGGRWQANPLTSTIGPATGDDPVTNGRGYTTNFASQGEVARVVYIAQDNHIKELSTSGGPWQLADLTVLGNGPPLGGRNMPFDPPMGYTSHLPNQGPAARVVYNTINGEIHELSIVP
jgi:hypothetical protein